jgi:hypothetical protein
MHVYQYFQSVNLIIFSHSDSDYIEGQGNLKSVETGGETDGETSSDSSLAANLMDDVIGDLLKNSETLKLRF